MIKISLINQLKDKKIRLLYESVSQMLNHIESANDQNYLMEYSKRLLQFLNGHTEKDILFKNLRKNIIDINDLHLQWMYEYTKFRIDYLNTNKIKRFEDLLFYSEKISSFSFLLLIISSNASNNIKTITEIAKIDVLKEMVLNANDFQIKGIKNFPSELVKDYNIEYSIDGKYMINDKYITLVQMFLYHIKNLVEQVSISLGSFNEVDESLITNYLIDVKSDLNNLIKKKYK